MIYLVGGPPRCGKSALAERVRERRGIAWTSTDLLRMVLQPLVPALAEADESGDAGREAELLFPHLERAVSVARGMASDYLIEGIGFFPRHVTKLNDGHSDVRACFLGWLRCDPEDVLGHSGNQWIEELDGAEVKALAKTIERASRELEAICATAGMAFVDVSANFDAGLERAEHLLLGDDR